MSCRVCGLFENHGRKKYTKEDMLKAMEAVDGGASTAAAAREFNVPRTTLIDKMAGRSTIDCTKGPATVLTEKEEGHLENWLIFMAASGFPVTKEQLLDSVSILMEKLNRKNPFKDNKPGRHWFEAFIKRHPKVGQRVAQNLTQTRARVTEKDIRTWFKEVEEFFETAQLKEASEDPQRIFNCDESAFFLSPTSNRVLAKRGSKNVYNVIPSGEKECVTVLLTANAAGELAPPMVLFKLKTIPHNISKRVPGDWGIGHTQKGWMTGESFYEYLTNVFFPWLQKTEIILPIIFYLDGHCSHTTLPLSNFCRQKNIILIALHPNATHLLQPMDVAVFRPLKMIWKKTVYDWRNENQFVKLKKENFCPLLKNALQQLDPNTISNGFRKSGLSPFDANSVDYSKCVTSRSGQLTAPLNVITQTKSDKNNHFNFFESQIHPSHLKAFKKNKGPTWQGDKTLQGLFTIWMQMKTQIQGLDNNGTDILNSSEDATRSTTENLRIARQSITSSPIKALNSKPQTDEYSLEQPEPIVPCEDSTWSKEFDNITGFSDIFDSNYSLYDISALDSIVDTPHEQHKNERNIELFEVINGEITKVTSDPEIYTHLDVPIIHENSLPVCSNEKQIITSPTSVITGQVMRTTGSNPIYLIPPRPDHMSRKVKVTSTITSSSMNITLPLADTQKEKGGSFLSSQIIDVSSLTTALARIPESPGSKLFHSHAFIKTNVTSTTTSVSQAICKAAAKSLCDAGMECTPRKQIKIQECNDMPQGLIRRDTTSTEKSCPAGRGVFADFETPYYSGIECTPMKVVDKQFAITQLPTIKTNEITPSRAVSDTQFIHSASPKVTSSMVMTVGQSPIQRFTEIICNPVQNETKQASVATKVGVVSDEGQDQSKKYFGNLVVPTPFKDALFWPETPSCPNTKQKVKIPSVITSDRWQIFAQKKNHDKEEKEKRKLEIKEKKSLKLAKSDIGKDSKTVTKRPRVMKKAAVTQNKKETQKDWYCRLCSTCAKMDMIQCLKCNTWYHTSCAGVQPDEVSFYCIYCNM